MSKYLNQELSILTEQTRAFFNSYSPSVKGWCSPFLCDFLSFFHLEQRRQGIRAGVLEIGVYEGQFFLLLNSFCDLDEHSVAVDVFDNAHMNIDYSGAGIKLSTFQHNIAQYDRHNGRNIQVIQSDSMKSDLLLQLHDHYRFISIDGGHTCEHTVSDLRLAQRKMHPEGIVVLDDIVNPHWLGVIEGALLFLADAPPLVPFAIGHNKLFLSHVTYASRYYQLFCNAGFAAKPLVRLGRYSLASC